MARPDREQEALDEMARTTFPTWVGGALCVLFFVVLTIPPAAHILRSPSSLFAAFSHLGRTFSGYARGDLLAANRTVLNAIEAVETEVGEGSPIGSALRPHVQQGLLDLFGAGNAQVTPLEGRLFYRPSLDHLLGPPFLEKTDPMKAIVAFQEDLLRRGIELVVIVAPVKPTVDGFGPLQPGLHNPSWPALHQDLRRHGITLVDVEPSGEGPHYLDTDTHWSWRTMEGVASKTAQTLHEMGLSRRTPAPLSGSFVEGRGDLFHLLDVEPKAVQPEKVRVGTATVKRSEPPRVLLLGDSFSNIYRDKSLHFGADRGFPETLSALLGENVDAIVINDGGASATRRALAQEAGRLEGISVVVWEFAARELSFGDWSSFPLQGGELDVVVDAVRVERGEHEAFTATIRRVAPAVSPSRAPYPNEIVAIELEAQLPERTQTAWAYTWSLRDGEPSRGALLRPGQHVTGVWGAFSDAPKEALSGSRSELEGRPGAAPALWVERWDD